MLCVVIPFLLEVRLVDASAGVTKEEGHTGFLHLPSVFGLTVSEAKTEIMCLRTKGMPESTATFSVEAAGQVHNQTNEFVYLGGNVNFN